MINVRTCLDMETMSEAKWIKLWSTDLNGGQISYLHFVHHSGHQANGLSWLLCNAKNSAMPQKAYFSGLEVSAVWCGAVSHEERICFSLQFHGNPFSKGLGMLFCETFWKVGPTFWTVSITYANSSTSAPIGCTTSGPCDLYDSIQSPPHTHTRAKIKDLWSNWTLELCPCSWSIVRMIRLVKDMVPPL